MDNPYTPRSGKKFTFTPQFAGGPLGGTVNYFKPDAEFIWYIPHFKKTALGIRAAGGLDQAVRRHPERCPIYQRFFLGGETQIRGVNIRTVGPIATTPRRPERALGGNKFVLFNAEYYFDVGGPLRLLLFFDAGQAYRGRRRRSTSSSSAPRRASSCGSSCPCSTCRSGSSTPSIPTGTRSSRSRPSSSRSAPRSKERVKQ